MLTGGGAMHLNDSLGASHDIEYVCTSHEQAAAMAAESYAKVTGDVGVCLVTAGPGGTNALTGVAGALARLDADAGASGQAKRADLKGDTGVRQVGVQEVDIVSMVSPITKYAVTVIEPATSAITSRRPCTSRAQGRPGPVWIDIPLDVQGATIDADSLRGFDPAELTRHPGLTRRRRSLADRSRARSICSTPPSGPWSHRQRRTARPGASAEMREADRASRHPRPDHLAGARHGAGRSIRSMSAGQVRSRRAARTSPCRTRDWLLAIGARLDLVVTGYAPENFARAGAENHGRHRSAELRKMQRHDSTFRCWPMPRRSFGEMPAADAIRCGGATDRLASRLLRRGRRSTPLCCRNTAICRRGQHVCPRRSHRRGRRRRRCDRLGELGAPASRSSCLAVTLQGRAAAVPHDGARRDGQRPARPSSAPASHNGRRTICVDGDGGLQLNIQELETVRRLASDQTVRAQQRRLRIDPDIAVTLLRTTGGRRHNERCHAATASGGRRSVRTALRADRQPIAGSSSACVNCWTRRGPSLSR